MWRCAIRGGHEPGLVWIEQEHFGGFACAHVDRRFNLPVWPPVRSFDEDDAQIRVAARQRIQIHVCAITPKEASSVVWAPIGQDPGLGRELICKIVHRLRTSPARVK